MAQKKGKKKATRAAAKKKSGDSSAVRAISKNQTKTQILRSISESTGLSIRDVKSVFTTAGELARCHLIKKGSGEFSVPELGIKIVRKTKPATKKKLGRNPATGETITIPAKPKRDVIKVRPLKSLKDVLA